MPSYGLCCCFARRHRCSDDWLVCMVSSQLQQLDSALDELVLPTQPDFAASGLKAPSVLRLSRLAVLSGNLLAGSIGRIDKARLVLLKQRLGRWIMPARAMPPGQRWCNV